MIVLCTGNELIRRRWRDGLAGFHDLIEANSIESLEQRLDTDRPELVVLHFELPGFDGARGVFRLRRRYPGVKFLVLSDVPGEREGFALLRSGIRGYANAYISPAYLAQAVKVIVLGDVWLGSHLLRGLVEELAHAHPRSTSPSEGTIAAAQPVQTLAPLLNRLTNRERQIVEFLAGGESNKGIAAKLGITERTVKAHLTSVFQKTGFKHRLQLALAFNGHRTAGASER